MNHGWFRLCLSAGGSDSDDRGRETPLYLATYHLVQASQRFGLLDLTTFISSSPELSSQFAGWTRDHFVTAGLIRDESTRCPGLGRCSVEDPRDLSMELLA